MLKVCVGNATRIWVELGSLLLAPPLVTHPTGLAPGASEALCPQNTRTWVPGPCPPLAEPQRGLPNHQQEVWGSQAGGE